MRGDQPAHLLIDQALDEWERRYPPRTLPHDAVVARIAPSPTGQPHIGTALQATIDYALARQSGGVFILRIEDTDRQRLVTGAVEEIVEALHWMGLDPDEGPHAGGTYGPYVQSERLDLYKTVANWLVAHGQAYPCFCSVERLEQLREEQRTAGLPPRYDRHCRGMSEEERHVCVARGEQSVIRLAMPIDGTIVFDDPARGQIAFAAADQDDPVLLKSDGYPTYHLAAIVDDHFMRVTVAVRGEEWLPSTPKHLVLYQAMGWTPPLIVHTPLLRDIHGRKLGKRWGDTSLAWFRLQGYLPEAMRNFITRLLWAHPDGNDIYPFADFIGALVPAALPKTGPVVNLGLLDFICGAYMRRLTIPTLDALFEQWLEWVEAHGPDPVVLTIADRKERLPYTLPQTTLAAFRQAWKAQRDMSRKVLGLEPEHFRKLGDIVVLTRFYFATLFDTPPVGLLTKPMKGDRSLTATVLRGYLQLDRWAETEQAWQGAVYEVAAAHGVKPGNVFMLLRVALTGTERTPPLYAIMALLGQAEVTRRLHEALLAVGQEST